MILSIDSHSLFPRSLFDGEEMMEKPTGYDIFFGRGKGMWNSPGNRKFRDLVLGFLHQYADAPSKAEKSKIVESVMEAVHEKGGRFLRKDTSSGEWGEVGPTDARSKVAHAIRDHLAAKHKSDIDAVPSFKQVTSSEGRRSPKRERKTKKNKKTGAFHPTPTAHKDPLLMSSQQIDLCNSMFMGDVGLSSTSAFDVTNSQLCGSRLLPDSLTMTFDQTGLSQLNQALSPDYILSLPGSHQDTKNFSTYPPTASQQILQDVSHLTTSAGQHQQDLLNAQQSFLSGQLSSHMMPMFNNGVSSHMEMAAAALERHNVMSSLQQQPSSTLLNATALQQQGALFSAGSPQHHEHMSIPGSDLLQVTSSSVPVQQALGISGLFGRDDAEVVDAPATDRLEPNHVFRHF